MNINRNILQAGTWKYLKIRAARYMIIIILFYLNIQVRHFYAFEIEICAPPVCDLVWQQNIC